MRILLIGPQGSGKSTQGKLLSEFLKIPVISTGDIFRQISSEDSERGKKIKEILSEGQLVDDQTTAEILLERVKQPDCQKGFILDGYPRNLEQIKLFDPGFDKVIYFKLSDEEATKRLLARGREDDTEQLIAERLRVYHEQTDPILDYYKQKDLLTTINGEGEIDQIQSQLRKVIGGQQE